MNTIGVISYYFLFPIAVVALGTWGCAVYFSVRHTLQIFRERSGSPWKLTMLRATPYSGRLLKSIAWFVATGIFGVIIGSIGETWGGWDDVWPG